ncbi:hypothetical protein LLG95_11285 [bacterium]|nr:hypothetical protein [bacterium]
MNTPALSALYLLQSALVFLVFIGIGSLVLPSPKASDRAEWAWNWILRCGAGIAGAVFVIIVFGLFGLINRWLPVTLAALAFAGLILHYSRPRATFGKDEKHTLQPGERNILIIVAVIYLLLNLNILIGGMVPSMGQDTLWYHLSVPVQWTLTGKAAAFPYVMPSNYALGMEAIYSALLLFSNEILCSMIYCQVVMVLLAGMAIAAYRYAGWIGALIVMGCIAPFTTTLAPVPPANDSAAVLLLLIGFVRLADSIKYDRSGIHHDLLTGFFLGSAIAVKLTSIIFVAPMIFFWAVFSWNRIRIRRVILALVLFGAGMFAAYAPWSVRGFQYCGNPVFPLAKSIFPVRPEYEAMQAASARLNASYPLTPKGIYDAVLGLPDKINYLLTGSDVMFWLVLLTAISLPFNKQKHIRFMGWTLLGFYGGFLIMRGHNEVGRYFGMGYPVSAPAIAIAFAIVISQMKQQSRALQILAPVFTVVLIASATGIYARNQIKQAKWTVFQWQFKPVVTQQAIDDFARHAEIRNYILYSKLQNVIESDARVFLADEVYPYYLKRKCIWGDEVAITAFQKSWSGKTADEMDEWLKSRNVQYVLSIKNEFAVFREMERRKMLRRIGFNSNYSQNAALWALAESRT